MYCFAHQTVSAVGICKACGKGVCARCAADTGEGLACRDQCEDRVLLLGRMVANNARVMRAANAQTRSQGLFAVLLGAVFLSVAGWTYTQGNSFSTVTVMTGGSGLIMVVFGLARLIGKRLPTSEESDA